MGNTLKLEDLLKPDCVPDESAGGENWRILHGDTLKLVKGFQPGIFDAVITDPVSYTHLTLPTILRV